MQEVTKNDQNGAVSNQLTTLERGVANLLMYEKGGAIYCVRTYHGLVSLQSS
jgi:hypothetical protein